jgi:hypothetical protein
MLSTSYNTICFAELLDAVNICMTNYSTGTHKVKLYDEISSVNAITPTLWEIDHCFLPDTIEWMQSIYENEGNEFVVGGLKKRMQLKFGSHDFARLNQIGIDMIPELSKVIGHALNFAEVKYWVDFPQFGCQMHSDAEDLFCSYQVYLYSSNKIVKNFTSTEVTDFELLAEGAIFHNTDPPSQIKFLPNHGYINLNTDLKQHWVPGRWDTRISVMFQYTRV